MWDCSLVRQPQQKMTATQSTPITAENLIARGQAAGYVFRPLQIEGIRKNNRMAIQSLIAMVRRMEAAK